MDDENKTYVKLYLLTIGITLLANGIVWIMFP